MRVPRSFWWRSPRRLGALVCCLCIVIRMSSATPRQQQEYENHGRLQRSRLTRSSNGSHNRTRAKISLKSESFDLDNEEQDLKKLLLEGSEPAGSFTKDNQTSSKSSRQLSNIWSMFLPAGGSSEINSESDYENESVDTGQETTTTTTSEAAGERENTTTVGKPTGGESLVASQSNGGERVWSGAAAAAAAVANRTSAARPVALDNATAATAAENEPVRLITGALTSGTINQTSGIDDAPLMPDMNEITSNIMGSLGASSRSPSEGERENDSGQEYAAVGNKTETSNNFERWLSRINATGTSEQPQQVDVTRKSFARQRQSASVGDPTTRPPKTVWDRKSASTIKSATIAAGSRRAPWPMQQQQHQQAQNIENQRLVASLQHGVKDATSAGEGTKGLPKRSAQHHQRYQSHPFQHQMRQQQQQQHHQQQLIHGIKQPQSQASTISVSNSSPDGASNTSLAFGSHYIPQITPILNAALQQETSQVAARLNNHNVSGLGAGQWSPEANLTLGNSGEAANQSQDEILRQVTSAINFEQQQQQQQQLMMSQQKRDSNANFDQQQQQQQKSPLSSSDDAQAPSYVTQDGALRLAASQINQTAATGSPLDNMLKASTGGGGGGGGANNLANSGDIDKSFDLLAEKVRQLAGQQQLLQQQQQMQQQQLMLPGASAGGHSNQTQQQPSWLRPQQLANALAATGSGTSTAAGASGKVDLHELLSIKQSSDNLTNLMAAAGGGDINSASLRQQQVDQIRELLQRHKKTKSELKSSQETMMALMRQMMQLKAGANSTSSAPAQVTSRPSEQASLEHQKAVADLLANGSPPGNAGAQLDEITNSPPQQPPPPADVSNVGWMPVNQASGAAGPKAAPAPPSPAQLMKNRVMFGHPQARPHQQHQNLGFLLSNQQNWQHPQQLVELDERVIGLPIALLNKNSELELSHDQLEDAARLAAEQLGAIPPANGQLHQMQQQQQQQQRPGGTSTSNKFVARLAQHGGPSEQQAAQPSDKQQQNLQHVQRFLQGDSQKTFNANNAHALARLHRMNSLQQSLEGGTSQLQRHHNLMQLEQLASLLPSPVDSHSSFEPDESPPSQIGDSISNQLSSSIGEHPNQIESKAAGTINAGSATNAAGNQLSQQGSSSNQQRQQQQQQSGGSANQSAGGSGGNFHRQAQQQRARQEMQQHQQRQIMSPREPLVRDFRAGLDSGAYLRPVMGLDGQQPARQIYDELPASYTPSHMGAPVGPALKLREMSFYRPFGFRTHHSISYQASPTVAAMFPRFVAQPEPAGLAAGSQAGRLSSATGSPARLLMPTLDAPGILRHMTPIRATLTEGQRLISQMLPHHHHHHEHYPLGNHLGGRSFHYQQHGYPTHDHLGQTLPIPPMRHLLAAGQPMRRRHSSAPPSGNTHKQIHQWASQQPKGLDLTPNAKNLQQGSQMVSSSGLRTRHMEPENELVVYSSGDVEPINQLGNGDNEDQEQLTLAGLAEEMPPGVLEDERLTHYTAQAPSRQMRAQQNSASGQQQHHPVLRVDKPSVLIKLPCVSPPQNATQVPMNVTNSNMTTSAPHSGINTRVGTGTQTVESIISTTTNTSTTTATPAMVTPATATIIV